MAKASQRRRLAREFECGLLLVHLSHHEATAAAVEENRADTLGKHLSWPAARVTRVLDRALRREWVRQLGPLVVLTDSGGADARVD